EGGGPLREAQRSAFERTPSPAGRYRDGRPRCIGPVTRPCRSPASPEPERREVDGAAVLHAVGVRVLVVRAELDDLGVLEARESVPRAGRDVAVVAGHEDLLVAAELEQHAPADHVEDLVLALVVVERAPVPAFEHQLLPAVLAIDDPVLLAPGLGDDVR